MGVFSGDHAVALACQPLTAHPPATFHRSPQMGGSVARDWGMNLTVGEAGLSQERKLWEIVFLEPNGSFYDGE